MQSLKRVTCLKENIYNFQTAMSGLFRLTHQRSHKAYRRRQEKERARLKTRDDLREAHNILLLFSWRDPLLVVGELVHTPESAEVVKEKLKEAFGGGVPQHVLSEDNHPFGEVLNYRLTLNL